MIDLTELQKPKQVCFLSAIKDYAPQYIGYSEDKHTHNSICVLAANWLMRNHKCRSLLVERGKGGGEMPDVIGFYFDDSFLIEVKISRSDFLADAKKPHRIEDGMGKYRYYACPKDLISASELPQDWGLLYITEKGSVKKIKDAIGRSDYDRDAEFIMLTSALASPWKLFQHWSDTAIERLSKINWMSKTMDADMKLFCGRLAANRLMTNDDDENISRAKDALFSLYENQTIKSTEFNAIRWAIEQAENAQDRKDKQ